MSESHSKARRLATETLQRAVANDWPGTSYYAQRLNDECGSAGTWTAMVGWIDTLSDHMNDGLIGFTPNRVKSQNVDTGEVGGPLPPRVEWAHNIISARLAGDEERFSALYLKLNEIKDGHERGRWMSALLESVSLTIRTYPRGYARAGGGS